MEGLGCGGVGVGGWGIGEAGGVGEGWRDGVGEGGGVEGLGEHRGREAVRSPKATCPKAMLPFPMAPDKACGESGACPGNFCGVSSQGVSGGPSLPPPRTVLPGQPSQVHPGCLKEHPKSLPAVSTGNAGRGASGGRFAPPPLPQA